METGYDYTLLGGRPRARSSRLPAVVVAALLGLVLVAGLAYYGLAGESQPDLAAASNSSVDEDTGAAVTEENIAVSTDAVKFNRPLPVAAPEQIAGQELYPAGFSDARHWVNPLGYEP